MLINNEVILRLLKYWLVKPYRNEESIIQPLVSKYLYMFEMLIE